MATGVVDVGGAPEVIDSRVVVEARRHGEVLAPQIAASLVAAGLAVTDLTAVVAGVGPGPFTGVRVGLATAAAVALTAELPTYAVCSLDAISARVAGAGVLVATDARRREVYWAVYDDGVRRAGPDVATPGDLAARLGAVEVWTMVGPGAREYADAFGLPLAGGGDYPGVRELAILAADRIRSGAASEALVPLYLRRPDAVPPRDVVQPE